MSMGASGADQVAANAPSPVLSVSGLTTSFLREREWSPVVRDVSFDIASGETVAIVGESGSGKSVTALSIMRLIPKENGRVEGRVQLAGRDLLTLPEASMKDVRGNEVAMIFQEPMTSLNPVALSGSVSLRMERPVVDLPQPDSPTSASVSPARKVKETFSTAWTRPETLPNRPERIGKRVVRLETSSSGRSAIETVSGVSAGSSEVPVSLSTTGKRIGRIRPSIEPRRGTAASSALV